jgi:hypothetical protein
MAACVWEIAPEHYPTAGNTEASKIFKEKTPSGKGGFFKLPLASGSGQKL